MGTENQGTGDAAFDEFAAAGEVQVGDSNVDAGAEEKKPAGRRPPKEIETTKDGVVADDQTGDDDDAGNDDDQGGDEEGGKPRKSAAEHQIERLKREKADLNRRLRALEGGAGSDAISRRLEAIESRLTGGNGNDTKTAGKPAPDPSDTDKYPLGHLDDRYIEDKLEWLADEKARAQADSVLQRQQENERNAAITQAQTALLEKVDDLASKGAEQFPDFQEEVVEAGMRGEWRLSQATFEAAAEAEHGAEILYNLSQDRKEAARVAGLSNYQQMKYVDEKNAEIAAGKRGRTKPQAGEPPRNQARGANSRTQINPATDNLDDFEKAWKQDEAKNGKR